MSSRNLYVRGLINRRETSIDPKRNICDHSIFRLLYLVTSLIIYYLINVWYFNEHDTYKNINKNNDYCDLWCSDFESNLYHIFTTIIVISNLFVTVFLITNYHTYTLEFTFNTEFNLVNKLTVLIFPLLYILSIILITAFTVNYNVSFIKLHDTNTHHMAIVLSQIANCFNQTCVLFCIACDLLNFHHAIQRSQRSYQIFLVCKHTHANIY